MLISLSPAIKSYLQDLDSKKVLIGFSWWPDSVACYALVSDYYISQWRDTHTIYLAHYNHNYRKESVQEADYIKKTYHNTIIETYTGGRFTEQALRDARHRFFRDCLNQVGSRTLILGHNLTDRLETTIMNIQRGAGANGIGNMQEIQKKEYLLKSAFTILRPLLHTPKHEIITYCKDRQLPYFTDLTNDDPQLSKRNIIRSKYIKPLEQGDLSPLKVRRDSTKSRLETHHHRDIDQLFDHYIKDDTVWWGLRRWYEAHWSNPIVSKPTQIDLPSYFGLEYCYRLPESVSMDEIIDILKWINEYGDSNKNYLNELLAFHKQWKSWYKSIGKRKFYRCHWESYLILPNTLFNPWQVLEFWLQYDTNLVRLVDLKNDTYHGKTVNKRFINNKIPLFLRNTVPVDKEGWYKDNLIWLLYNTL